MILDVVRCDVIEPGCGNGARVKTHLNQHKKSMRNVRVGQFLINGSCKS